MSRAVKKYRREEKAYKDRKQSVFTKTATIKSKQKPKVGVESLYSMTEQFACPFCLGLHKFQQYLISTKHGIHQGLGQCPECNNKFRFRTLTQITTAKQYAEFAYPYSASGFWQKVPWSKWKDRLYKIGWSQAFWHRYHELKGEDVDKQPLSDEQEDKIEDDWEAYEKRYGGG